MHDATQELSIQKANDNLVYDTYHCEENFVVSGLIPKGELRLCDMIIPIFSEEYIPTKEQRKNLKEVFGIEITLFNE